MIDWLSHLPLLRSLLCVLSLMLASLIVRWVIAILLRRLASRGRLKNPDLLIKYIGSALLWCSVFIGLDLSIDKQLLPTFLQPVIHPSLVSLCIMVVARSLASILGSLIAQPEHAGPQTIATSTLLHNGIRLSILVIALILILDSFGIAVTTIVATLGIGGLALALALQDTLTNLFAGMYITLANQMRVGDVIVFENFEGTIRDIGWRNTLIRRGDESLLICPNSKLSQSIVASYAKDAISARSKIAIQISLDQDLAGLPDLIRTALSQQNIPSILPQPAPLVRFGDNKDGYVELIIAFAVEKYAGRAEAQSELFKLIHQTLRDNAIRIHIPER